jgi:CubicO group peptidase (beta-lactamase class C family)
MIKKVVYSLSLVLLIVFQQAYANSDPRIEKFDELVSSYYDAGLFSGGVLVAENGRIIFKKMYGIANREDNIANESATKFRIGSISKQFTATAIMLLQQQGKLSVNDTIRKHIPDYPSVGDKITIHQLLNHTSGIPEYITYPDFEDIATHHMSFIDLINRFKDKPLDFESGTQWKYSNSGYVLLGYIIEKVSDMTYDTFLKRYIFIPAKLNNTMTENPRHIIQQRAKGYDLLSDNTVHNAEYIDLSSAQAAGSILSTLDDLYNWDRVLYSTNVLSESSKNSMFKDQSGYGYGYGWSIDQAFGHQRVRHGGAINGFLSEFSRYIDVGATVIVWNNTISGEPNREIADALGGILFNVPYEAISNNHQILPNHINQHSYY